MARPETCPVCSGGNPAELEQCQWCKVGFAMSAGGGSLTLATYLDGRSVNYVPGSRTFDVAGAPVTLDMVRAYDAARQLRWVSEVARKRALFPPDESPLSSKDYVVYTLLFAVFSGFSGLIATVLYFGWRESQPVRARQVLRLGWIVFGIVILLMTVLDRLGALGEPF